MKTLATFFFVMACLVMSSYADYKNLGMIALKSTRNTYLQGYSNGELHSSNSKRNEEETWFLVEVDHAEHIFGIYNWKHGTFISANKESGCAASKSTILGPNEKWKIISGKSVGIENGVKIQSVVAPNLYLQAADKDQEPCGGEVKMFPDFNNYGLSHSDWPGWWVMSSVDQPTPGKDFWNTIGNKVMDVLNNITPADVAAIMSAL